MKRLTLALLMFLFLSSSAIAGGWDGVKGQKRDSDHLNIRYFWGHHT